MAGRRAREFSRFKAFVTFFSEPKVQSGHSVSTSWRCAWSKDFSWGRYTVLWTVQMSRRPAGQSWTRDVCTVQQALQKTLCAGTGMRSSGLCGTVEGVGEGIVGAMMLRRRSVDECVLPRTVYYL